MGHYNLYYVCDIPRQIKSVSKFIDPEPYFVSLCGSGKAITLAMSCPRGASVFLAFRYPRGSVA